MRFVLLVAIGSVFAPTQGRKSRLVTRGLDDAAPLPTAAAISGGQITNGLGRLIQCPRSTTACARHRPHADDGGARATPTLDCIDTDVDFRSCGGCVFPHKGQDKGEDCTQIEGAADAACECGTCVVRSCRPGYVLDSTAAFCAWHGIVESAAPALKDSKEGGTWWLWWWIP
ncbi:hypothetical protein B0H14DRAFT_3450637 [Mycena olivaceomarginata]|nr:hypothetical protein B0H14DRAFT_3450637 [Mycena olivaceomarginata]